MRLTLWCFFPMTEYQTYWKIFTLTQPLHWVTFEWRIVRYFSNNVIQLRNNALTTKYHGDLNKRLNAYRFGQIQNSFKMQHQHWKLVTLVWVVYYQKHSHYRLRDQPTFFSFLLKLFRNLWQPQLCMRLKQTTDCQTGFQLCVPVFISVDSPDHSNANANSSKYEWAHGEVPALDREATKKGTAIQ